MKKKYTYKYKKDNSDQAVLAEIVTIFLEVSKTEKLIIRNSFSLSD